MTCRCEEYRKALKDAYESLWRAWQMLSAIHDSEPSADRRKARDDAAEAMKLAGRVALAPPPPSEEREPPPGVPRRACTDLFTPAETAIQAAVRAVEDAGCDVRLTTAVRLLDDARSWVADFVDGVAPENHYPRPAPSPVSAESPEPERCNCDHRERATGPHADDCPAAPPADPKEENPS